MNAHNVDGDGIPYSFRAPNGRLIELGPYAPQAQKAQVHLDPLSEQVLSAIASKRLLELRLPSSIPKPAEQLGDCKSKSNRIRKFLRSGTALCLASTGAVVGGTVGLTWMLSHLGDNQVDPRTVSRKPFAALETDIQANARRDDFLTASLEDKGVLTPRYTGRIDLSVGACVLQGVTIDTIPANSPDSRSIVPTLPTRISDITTYYFDTGKESYTFVNQADLQQQVGGNPCTVLAPGTQ